VADGAARSLRIKPSSAVIHILRWAVHPPGYGHQCGGEVTLVIRPYAADERTRAAKPLSTAGYLAPAMSPRAGVLGRVGEERRPPNLEERSFEPTSKRPTSTGLE